MPHLQDHPRLRRHGLRRMAAAGRGHVDPGPARRGAGTSRSTRGQRRRRGTHRRRGARARPGRQFLAPRVRSTTRALIRALNARLPEAVRVLAAERVPATFHARFGATGKTYRYRIWNTGVVSPFERAFTWHVTRAARSTRDGGCRRASSKGRHDFAAFKAAGGATRSTEREMFSSRVVAGSGDPIDAGRRPARQPSDRLRDLGHRIPSPHGPHHRRHARGDRPGPPAGRVDVRGPGRTRSDAGGSDGAGAGTGAGGGRVRRRARLRLVAKPFTITIYYELPLGIRSRRARTPKGLVNVA